MTTTSEASERQTSSGKTKSDVRTRRKRDALMIVVLLWRQMFRVQRIRDADVMLRPVL